MKLQIPLVATGGGARGGLSTEQPHFLCPLLFIPSVYPPLGAALGRVIAYNLLDCEPHFSALPFLKYVSVFCDTVLEKRGSRHKICQLMTRSK